MVVLRAQRQWHTTRRVLVMKCNNEGQAFPHISRSTTNRVRQFAKTDQFFLQNKKDVSLLCALYSLAPPQQQEDSVQVVSGVCSPLMACHQSGHPLELLAFEVLRILQEH